MSLSKHWTTHLVEGQQNTIGLIQVSWVRVISEQATADSSLVLAALRLAANRSE
jgi:hypothetical protein